MKIYLAGPMTDRPRFNFDEFDRHAAMLRGRGHIVISPAELDRAEGFDPDRHDLDFFKRGIAHFIQRDTLAILECDAIAGGAPWYQTSLRE
jgi:nucleoside 2-deoxyribosyltransferase